MQWAPPEVEVIAHRGASAYAPEHTLAAYDLAVAQGADTLELDVRATPDGELVVLHDRDLLRTAGVARDIADLDADAIARMDPATRPLTLDAVLDRYAGVARFFLELKDPVAEWEAGVIGAVDRLRDRVLVASFDSDALRRLRHRAPWLTVAPLYDCDPPRGAGLAAVALYASGIGPRHEDVDAALVADAHAHGLSVRAWTADATADIDRLVASGVDGVITNVPDRARAVADRRAALAAA